MAGVIKVKNSQGEWIKIPNLGVKPMTGQDILDILSPVDGEGSGLDADKLAGYNKDHYATAASLANKVNTSAIGANNGIAQLDSTGKVPVGQLPSFVSDVLEGTYVNSTTFNDPDGNKYLGETGKIYVDTVSNLTYRWSGTIYAEISQSIALGETSSTAYAGDKGKAVTTALNTHKNDEANPHAVTKAQVGLSNVDNTADNTKSVASAAKLTTARNINGVAFDGTKDITLTANAADVYTWAKAANKPTYTAGEVDALSTAGGTINGSLIAPGIIVTSSGSPVGNLSYTISNGVGLFSAKANKTLGIKDDGQLLFNTDKVWHAGNDGYGSGLDADMLNGKRANEFISFNNDIDANTKPYNIMGYGYPTKGFPNSGPAICFGADDKYSKQIWGNATNDLLQVRTISAGVASSWRTFAFTDSNVASATKLQTARTFWGQAFDGTGNVTGDIGTTRIYVDTSTNGGAWNTGKGAYNVSIFNNASQTPLMLAYRAGSTDNAGANRVFAMELLNDGAALRFAFGGTEKFIFYRDGTITGTTFNGNAASANKLTNARTIDGVAFDGTASITTPYQDYITGNSEITTLTSMNPTKRSVIATLSAATNISFTNAMKAGWDINIHCVPTAVFTQPIPYLGSWSSMSGSSYTTTVGKSFEINIWCYKAGYYSIALREAD